jgi:hypothetical protein
MNHSYPRDIETPAERSIRIAATYKAAVEMAEALRLRVGQPRWAASWRLGMKASEADRTAAYRVLGYMPYQFETDDEWEAPSCDICEMPEDQEMDGRTENDWNGDTGCHLSCEQQEAWNQSRGIKP